MKKYDDHLNDSNAIDETATGLKETNIEDNLLHPFTITKNILSTIMDKYLTRKFTEDIDFLVQKGGIDL
jgi:hypothetical protein